MDLRVIALLIMTVFLFAIGLLVFFKNRKNVVNIFYGLFVIFMAIWSLGLAMFYFNPEISVMHFWANFLYVAGGLIAVFFFYFSLIFPSSSSPISNVKKLLIFLPNIVLFIMFFFTNLILKDVFIEDGTRGFIYGPFHFLFDLQFIVFFLWGFLNLIKKYKQEADIAKAQLKYIILGTSLGLIIAGTTNVILPWFNNFEYLWIGPVAALIWIGFNAYAILKYRLMDIRIVIRQSVVYFFAFVSIVALSIGVHFLLNYLFSLSAILEVIIITVLAAVLFNYLVNQYLKVANKYFFYSFYSYQETIKGLSSKLISILDLDELTDTIVKEIMDVMKLNRAGVLLREKETDKYEIQHIIGFREDNGISLVRNNFLTQRLEQTKKPIVHEELGLQIRDIHDKKIKENLINLQSNMKRIEAELCLPLISRDKLKGVIVLGKKLSGEAYSVQDLNLLESLAIQASLAIENAQLYDQVQDFSKNLESKVSEQTKEIRQKTDHLEELLKKNEALSQMKTEFLRVVNHQLRTPTSIIKGMLSMLVEGSIKGKKKKEEAIDKLYSSADRLETILDDILDAQDLIDGKPSPNLDPTDIEELINKVISPILILAKQKNIKLGFKKSAKQLPKILLDAGLIEKAIKKLVDNAVLYTEKGEVIIEAKVVEDKQTQKEILEIRVKDTGVGVVDEDKQRLFKIFTRGNQAERIHQNGSGLGLYIAKEYIEAHQGRIEAESEGENKGTTFIITLPIVTEV